MSKAYVVAVIFVWDDNLYEAFGASMPTLLHCSRSKCSTLLPCISSSHEMTRKKSLAPMQDFFFISTNIKRLTAGIN